MPNRGIWKAGLVSAAVLCSVTAVIAATSSRRHSDKIDVVDVSALESVAEILAFDPFEGSILPATLETEEVKMEAVMGASLNTAVSLFNEGAREVAFAQNGLGRSLRARERVAQDKEDGKNDTRKEAERASMGKPGSHVGKRNGDNTEISEERERSRFPCAGRRFKR